MSYINKSISAGGDEKTFIKTFIEQLTATDSRITCNTDIDAQFSNTSAQPTFTINFGTNSKIVFTRQNPLANITSSYYDTKVYVNSSQTSIQLYFASSSLDYRTSTTRIWKFTVATGDNVVYIALGAYDSAMPSTAKLSVMGIYDNEFSAAAFAKSANPLGSEFYCTDSVNQNIIVKFTDRLNYAVDNGNVEIIKNKVLLDSAKTTKIRDFSGLCDSSTVTVYSFLRIENDSYYAITNHTLIKINSGDE